MATDADYGTGRQSYRRSGRRDGHYSRQIPAGEQSNASASAFYRPYSAPLDQDVRPANQRRADVSTSSNQEHGLGFETANHPAGLRYDSANHSSAFGAFSRSYDVSLALTPSTTSRLAPATAPITPPSGLRGNQGDGAGDGLNVGGRGYDGDEGDGGHDRSDRFSSRQTSTKLSSRQLDFERPDTAH